MEEHDWLPVSSYSRLRTKTPNVLRLDVCHSSLDVIDLNTDVVDTAGLVLIKETGDRRLLALGVQQLQLCVGQLDKHRGDAMLG